MLLGAFLEALSSHGLANFKLRMHSLKRLDNGEWIVKSEGDVAVEIQALGETVSDDLVTPTRDTFGHYLNLPALKRSPHVHLIQSLCLDENIAGGRINGSIPSVNFKVPVQIKKDELIQLSWKE